jgi:DNA primase
MDTISLQGAGFFNTVAVSGSALTEKHLQILKRITHKLYLCFDSDNA